MPDLQMLAVVLLTFILLFFSTIESAISNLSRLSLRVLAEREKAPRFALLGEVAHDRVRVLMPLQFSSQILLGAITVSVILTLLDQEISHPALWSLVAVVSIVFVFRQLLPRLITQNDPERVLLKLIPFLRNVYPLLRWLTFPLTILLEVSQSAKEKPRPVAEVEDEEATDEEIHAYIGVGEEEGIFEQEESELIQSALEFGDTLVREIMTPRTQIVAIEENASVGELRDLIVSSKFSRIPVYRDRIDQIVGLVYVRNLLGSLGAGAWDAPITSLISKPWFVPETKNVAALLKEMQLNAEHMAIAINEYAAVSGLVTIEDVIEEIVGEIRDEDEVEKVDLIYEKDGTYLVRGGADVEELEETLDIDLGEVHVTTASGLIVAHLGKVPMAGEKVVLNGLEVEVLSSDRKKIQSMRMRKLVHKVSDTRDCGCK